MPKSIIKCQIFPDCYSSCPLISLPCVCFASIYTSTAAQILYFKLHVDVAVWLQVVHCCIRPNVIIRQPIELESCSNTKTCRKVFYFWLKKIGKFGFDSFLSDVILRKGLGFFGLRHQALGPNTRGNCSSFWIDTRRNFASLVPLIRFLAFVVSNLWPKNNKPNKINKQTIN